MTAAKPKTKKKEPKEIKCYFCGHVIENSHDHVIKIVPLAGKMGKIRNYKRQLHLDCVSKYNEGLENKDMLSKENSDWDSLYKYFRKEVLGMEEIKPLPEHAVKRLLGMRLGQFYPSGNNTRVLPRGYDFKTILVAMKISNPKIQSYMKTANFTNFDHRVNGALKFVVSELPDVERRLKAQAKASSKVTEEEAKQKFDYNANIIKRSDNGVKDNINKLLGGNL